MSKAQIEGARTEAERLVRWAAGLTREEFLLDPEVELEPKVLAHLEECMGRRERREPLPYIFEQAEFYSLSFRVSPAVIVPRPETEHLVEAAVEHAERIEARLAADVGTGSGALAVVLARELKTVQIVATDISLEALRIARENTATYGLEGRVLTVCCDLLSGIGHRLDCIVANLPYIRRDEFEELEPEVKDHEPRLALDGGSDGLGLIRRLTVGLCDHLNKGGFVALEVGAGQSDEVAKLLDGEGFERIEVLPDYAGIERVIIGWKPGA